MLEERNSEGQVDENLVWLPLARLAPPLFLPEVWAAASESAGMRGR